MILSCLADHSAIRGIFTVCRVVFVIAGLAVGWSYVMCPHCGGSLLLGGRIPSDRPNYCPHCDEKL